MLLPKFACGLLAISCLTPMLCAAGLVQLTEKPKQVSAEDWQNAKGKPISEKDLRFVGVGNYIGGIDRIWWLVLSGLPSNKFHYFFAELPGNATEVQGTYEIKENLAWFEGAIWNGQAIDKKNGSPVRFALNYGQFDGKPYFNLFLKNDKGHYQYERQWALLASKEGIFREHHKITFIPEESTQKQLKFTVKAELKRWEDKAPKGTPHFFEITATYDNQGGYWVKTPGQAAWLPQILYPHGGKLSAKDWPACFHLQGSYFGQIQGFTYSDLPPKWSKP